MNWISCIQTARITYIIHYIKYIHPYLFVWPPNFLLAVVIMLFSCSHLRDLNFMKHITTRWNKYCTPAGLIKVDFNRNGENQGRQCVWTTGKATCFNRHTDLYFLYLPKTRRFAWFQNCLALAFLVFCFLSYWLLPLATCTMVALWCFLLLHIIMCEFLLNYEYDNIMYFIVWVLKGANEFWCTVFISVMLPDCVTVTH